MKKQVFLGIIGLMILSFAQLSEIFAQSSANFEIKQSVVANGGGITAGVAYSVNGTIGQPTAGQLMIGTNFSITNGFWAANTLNCSYLLNPASGSAATAGGTGNIGIAAITGCLWNAVSNDGWLSVAGNNSGSGSGVSGFAAVNNSGATRTGTITIAGQLFTVTQAGAGPSYEADVASRPFGNGGVTSTDVSMIQGFQLGIGLPYQNNEFQRADCAPLASRGDGKITSIDVSQAQGYQLGFSALQLTAGPLTPGAQAGQIASLVKDDSTGDALKVNQNAARQVRIANTAAIAGQTVVVPIEVDALGDESVYGFGIGYDSTKLTNPIITGGTTGGAVLSNKSQPGKIGVSVNFGGKTIAAGANQRLVNVQFTIAPNVSAGTTAIVFTDQPTYREVASAPGTAGGVIALPTAFNDGNLNIADATTVFVSGKVLTTEGRGIKNVVVSLTDAKGEVRTVNSQTGGEFQFTDVVVGQTYTIAVRAKHYSFNQSSQLINIKNETNDINFTGSSLKVGAGLK